MKKVYVNMLLEIVELAKDVITSSVGEVKFEDDQPDYKYSKKAWGGEL